MDDGMYMAALESVKGILPPPPPSSMRVVSTISVSSSISMSAELHEPAILPWPFSGPRRLALPLRGSEGEAEPEGDGSEG